MICIDNSEWMRNGDYSPNRFQALADAVNLICGAKTQVFYFFLQAILFLGFLLCIEMIYLPFSEKQLGCIFTVLFFDVGTLCAV